METVSDDLRAKYPNLEYFWPFLDELSKETARGKVLMCAGFLEEQLRVVLLSFLLEVKAATELLNGQNAPLGSFGARIDACCSMGLISNNEHNDLHIVRRIRNEFAHGTTVSFHDEAIKAKCARLVLKAHDYGRVDGRVEIKVGATGQFETSATALILNLINRPHYVGQKRLAVQPWKY